MSNTLKNLNKKRRRGDHNYSELSDIDGESDDLVSELSDVSSNLNFGKKKRQSDQPFK